MTTIAFDTIAHDGVIDLPVEQLSLNGKSVKVIITDDDTTDADALIEDLQDIIAAHAVLRRINTEAEKTYSIEEMEARLNAMDN